MKLFKYSGLNYIYTNVKKLVYGYYTRSLSKKYTENGIKPKHIGFILDGNRRAANKLGISSQEGHELGAEKFKDVLQWCFDLDIKVISCWIFSTENFSRENEEINHILKLTQEYFKQMRDDKKIHQYKVKILVSGEINLLPQGLQDEIEKTKECTKNYNDFILNICLAYGGRAEITNAVREICKDVLSEEIKLENINEELISKKMYTSSIPDPDLIIRTSKEIRLSGFLLWQGIYSELYFSDVYWPLFRKIDFLRAIITYQNRVRNYGK